MVLVVINSSFLLDLITINLIYCQGITETPSGKFTGLRIIKPSYYILWNVFRNEEKIRKQKVFCTYSSDIIF